MKVKSVFFPLGIQQLFSLLIYLHIGIEWMLWKYSVSYQLLLGNSLIRQVLVDKDATENIGHNDHKKGKTTTKKCKTTEEPFRCSNLYKVVPVDSPLLLEAHKN